MTTNTLHGKDRNKNKKKERLETSLCKYLIRCTCYQYYKPTTHWLYLTKNHLTRRSLFNTSFLFHLRVRYVTY